MVSFDVTKEEAELIHAIALKAARQFDLDPLNIEMDICATHANGNPLRLGELLHAKGFNFTHDIIGISNHIDRKTGKLKDFFVPRYSAPIQS